MSFVTLPAALNFLIIVPAADRGELFVMMFSCLSYVEEWLSEKYVCHIIHLTEAAGHAHHIFSNEPLKYIINKYLKNSYHYLKELLEVSITLHNLVIYLKIYFFKWNLILFSFRAAQTQNAEGNCITYAGIKTFKKSQY